MSLPLHINLSLEQRLTLAPSVARYPYHLLPKNKMINTKVRKGWTPDIRRPLSRSQSTVNVLRQATWTTGHCLFCKWSQVCLYVFWDVLTYKVADKYRRRNMLPRSSGSNKDFLRWTRKRNILRQDVSGDMGIKLTTRLPVCAYTQHVKTIGLPTL